MSVTHPTRKAEDAIDAVMDSDNDAAEKLHDLRYIAAYAMARFYDIVTTGQVGASVLIDYATMNSLPPTTDRARRRRQKRERTAIDATS